MDLRRPSPLIAWFRRARAGPWDAAATDRPAPAAAALPATGGIGQASGGGGDGRRGARTGVRWGGAGVAIDRLRRGRHAAAARPGTRVARRRRAGGDRRVAAASGGDGSGGNATGGTARCGRGTGGGRGGGSAGAKGTGRRARGARGAKGTGGGGSGARPRRAGQPAPGAARAAPPGAAAVQGVRRRPDRLRRHAAPEGQLVLQLEADPEQRLLEHGHPVRADDLGTHGQRAERVRRSPARSRRS